MRELHIATVALQRDEIYFMQRRENKARIGAADLIGFFGGKIKANETDEAAARRELEEEAAITFPDHPLEMLGRVKVVSDFEKKPVKIDMVVFGYELPEQLELKPTEGAVVTVKEQDVFASPYEFTPGTRRFFETYKGENEGV